MPNQSPLSSKCDYPNKPWYASDEHDFDPEPFLEYTDDDGNVESEYMCNKCRQVKIIRTENNA